MILGCLWMTLTCVRTRCDGANGVLFAVNVTVKPELFLIPEEQFFSNLLHWFIVLKVP